MRNLYFRFFLVRISSERGGEFASFEFSHRLSNCERISANNNQNAMNSMSLVMKIRADISRDDLCSYSRFWSY